MDLSKKLIDLTIGDLIAFSNTISVMSKAIECPRLPSTTIETAAPPPTPPPAPSVPEAAPTPPAAPPPPAAPTKPTLPTELYAKWEDCWFNRNRKDEGRAYLKELDAEGVVKSASIVLKRHKDYNPDMPVEELRSMLWDWINTWTD